MIEVVTRDRQIEWLVLPSWNRLHRVREIIWVGGDPDIECLGDGKAICGASGEFCIPGFLSRAMLPRCAHCCDKLGIVRGKGNPSNAEIEDS